MMDQSSEYEVLGLEISDLRSQLDVLRNDHCDFTIVINKTNLKVHKFILILWSDFFKALFRHESKESRTNQIIFDDISPSALENIIEFCYTFRLKLDNDNIQDILLASSKLQIKKIQELCVQYITSRIDKSNCLGVLQIANRCNLTDLIRITMDYCLDYFLLLQDEEEFTQLDTSFLRQLLASDRLNVDNELDIVNLVIRWYSYQSNCNYQDLDDILSYVRYALVKPRDLVELSSNELISQLNRSTKLINQAKDFHLSNNQPNTYSKEIHNACMNINPRLTFRRRQRIYAVGGWDGNRAIAQVEKYDPYSDKWTQVEPMTRPRCAVGAVILDDFLYAVGGHDGIQHLKSVERYNLKTRKWTQDVPDMSIQRSSVAVIVIHGNVYAIGGQNEGAAGRSCLDIVERYDPIRGKWELCQPLIEKRLGAGVAALNDNIYVIGGSSDGETLETVEKYNPNTDQWVPVKSMNSPRKHFGCASYKGRIYAFFGRGGKCDKHTESGEVYDPVTDTWTIIDAMEIKSSGFGMVAFDNFIFAAGGIWYPSNYDQHGNSNNQPLSSVRVYEPETNEWERRNNMISRRLGFGLVLHSLLGKSS